ncbi:MAG: TonB-dependent receptor plug domain-containing protein [Fibrobacterota bacterium]|nr:TonB-dependent receptor [Chitinispirillaceae bacterium]
MTETFPSMINASCCPPAKKHLAVKHTNSLQHIFTVWIITCLCLAVFADQSQENDVFQLSLEDLGNIVVTPSKAPQQTGMITQKIDVISRDALSKTVSGNRNICEVIAPLPGVSVCALSRNDANWGTYGGIGPKYSTYMLQGLPVDAFIDPMSLDLNAIDHIEVLRGPASVFYPNYLSQDFAGSQSPLAGTVNLILKQKIDSNQTFFRTSYGTYNTLNGQFFQQKRIGLLNYFGGSSFEMSDYVKYGTVGSWHAMSKNPDYRKTKIYGGLTLMMDPEERHKLTVYAHRTWHDGDAGRIYRGYSNRYGTINAGYEIAITNTIGLQSHIGLRTYDRNWQESRVSLADIDTLTRIETVDQSVIPADIALSIRHGDAGLLSIGCDYQQIMYSTSSDTLSGRAYYNSKCATLQGGAYAQEEYRFFDRLILRGGLRYGYIRNDIELGDAKLPSDDFVRWENLLWSAGVRYNITNAVSVYTNCGNSFIIPGLKSSSGTLRAGDRGVAGRNGQLPNPGLKPENGIGTDAGIDIQLPAQCKVALRGFYITIEDAIVDIVISPNPSQTQSVNAGASRSSGGEIEFKQKINTTLSWFVNATGISTRITNDHDPDADNVEIPFSPAFVANFGADYHAPFGLTLSPSLNYNHGFYDGTSKASRRLFKPGIVFNAYIAQVLSKGDSYSIECFAQLYNITNNKFDIPWQFRNTGFSAMGGLRVLF